MGAILSRIVAVVIVIAAQYARAYFEGKVVAVADGGTYANAEQIRRGIAWVYDRHATDRGLYVLQKQTQDRQLGLWSDPSPIPPWEWRRRGRSH